MSCPLHLHHVNLFENTTKTFFFRENVVRVGRTGKTNTNRASPSGWYQLNDNNVKNNNNNNNIDNMTRRTSRRHLRTTIIIIINSVRARSSRSIRVIHPRRAQYTNTRRAIFTSVFAFALLVVVLLRANLIEANAINTHFYYTAVGCTQ